MILTPTQLYAILKNCDIQHGGNNIQGRITGTTICLRESAGHTDARCLDHTATPNDPPGSHSNCNKPGKGDDRGIWQWNSKAHPTITDQDADNPTIATELAYQASDGFKTWGPWLGAPLPKPGSPIYTAAVAASIANGDGPNPTPPTTIGDAMNNGMFHNLETYIYANTTYPPGHVYWYWQPDGTTRHITDTNEVIVRGGISSSIGLTNTQLATIKGLPTT